LSFMIGTTCSEIFPRMTSGTARITTSAAGAASSRELTSRPSSFRRAWPASEASTEWIGAPARLRMFETRVPIFPRAAERRVGDVCYPWLEPVHSKNYERAHDGLADI